MNTDVAFVPLFGTFLSEDPQKESKCFLKNTHGGFLTHLALPLTLWHVFSTDSLPPLSFSRKVPECSLLHSALVQVQNRIEGIKKPDGQSGASGRWDCV
jgi:hypothetical protein